jgi:hypothetical protein
MSDLADCYAATAVLPDGLAPRDRLVAEFESRGRSANSAETNDQSLVLGELEATNSPQDGLGPINGHCAVDGVTAGCDCG